VQAEKTVNSCFILPILPHKIGNVRDFWDDVSEKYREDTGDQLRGTGVKRMLAFLQAMPEKGDYLVLFLQSAHSLGETLKEIFSTDVEYSRYLTDQFKDFTGIDMAREESLPDVQMLMDWKDTRQYLEEKDMLKMPWCFAVPILPGKTEELLRILKEAENTRMPEIEDMMRHHDIIRSLTCLQRTKDGDFMVRHIIASNPLDDLIEAYTACNNKTCAIARKMIKEFTGLDFADPKHKPHVELLFKWDETRGFETADQVIAYTE